MPIRPIVNFTTAPGYKAAKKLLQVLKNNIKINNNHSIRNNIEFVNRVKSLRMLPQYKLMSFDIVNLYTNVPVTQTINIVQENLERSGSLNQQEVQELIMLLRVILSQNYFTFDNRFFAQDDGLAMGSPLSGFLADLYLNHFENEYVLSHKNRFYKKIISYTRYVDDTFLVFDGTRRQAEILNKYINSIHPNIKFTLELENEHSLNFLDLMIQNINNHLKFKIYRKPTTTDITIHASSFHPFAQKMASFNSFVNRLLKIPLEPEDYREELSTIKYIAMANGYNSVIVDRLVKKQKKNLHRNNNETHNRVQKYIATEYTNLLPNTIYNVFRKYDYTVSFKTNNSILKTLRPKSNKPVESCSGVYKIECEVCNSFYIGQTGRKCLDRYKEHLPRGNIRNVKSNFAMHIIDHNHAYSNFRNNFKPLHFCKKGKLMDALEEFEIYRASTTHNDQLLNEKLSFKSNELYDTAIRMLKQHDK